MKKIKEFKNLKEMINNSAKQFGDKIAFNGSINKNGRDVTYNQLREEMNALGTSLIDLGLKDKYICVIGENRYEWALSYLSVVNGVGKIVPLDVQLSEEEIKTLIDECSAKCVIYSKKAEKKIKNIQVESVSHYICMDEKEDENEEYIYDIVDKGKKIIQDGNREYIDTKIDETAFSVLLFTSGTTGFSKGVMLSHKNLSSNVWDVWPLVEIDETDRLLSILPLHHTYECTCGLLVPLAYGSTIAYARSLKHMADDIKLSKPTFLVTVPLITEKVYNKIMEKVSASKIKNVLFHTLLFLSPVFKKIGGRKLLKKIFKDVHDVFGGHLNIFISGASHIDPKISKSYDKMGFYFLQGYGLTECSPMVLGNSINYHRPDALGKPLPNVEVKLADKNEKGLGEIIVKGPNVMLGYFNNEEKTNEVLKDGWFYTGDMAKFSKSGFFYMTGRKKNIIVTKTGKNIYPEEIENEINKLLFVSESVILSDHERINDTNIVKAVIYPNIEKMEKALDKRNLSINEISEVIKKEIQKINKKFPTYKKIRDVQITLEEFKKTTTKKIKRHKVSKDS